MGSTDPEAMFPHMHFNNDSKCNMQNIVIITNVDHNIGITEDHCRYTEPYYVYFPDGS